MISIIVHMEDYSQASINALYSLTHGYQKNVVPADWEVIAIGSKRSASEDARSLKPSDTNITHLISEGTIDSFLKLALQHAKGEQIGLLFDSRRIFTPRIIEYVKMAFKIKPSPLIAIPGYTINDNAAAVDTIDWKSNGYRLFGVSHLDGNNNDGFLTPLEECGALFFNKSLLAMLLERGCLNDLNTQHVANTLYLRLGMLEDTALVVTPGEGAFLQNTDTATPDLSPENCASPEKPRLMREPILIGSITYLAQQFFLLSAEHASKRFLALSKNNAPYWNDDAPFSRYTENANSDQHENKIWPSWKIKPTKFWG